MQLKKAQKISSQNDNMPCDHPNLSKEYHLGSATGDYVCTACGESRFGRNWGRDWVERNQSEVES
ncbi:hypothetical protein [Shewanella baltica]|uniref:hypothetical protein n=1 Tax=Shewanella baltica TaxID=62322 RepID=UPI003D7AA71A